MNLYLPIANLSVNALVIVALGGLMLREAVVAIGIAKGRRPPPRKRRHLPLVAALPLRMRFYKSGLYISRLAPLLLGAATGVLTTLLGVGGGFMLASAMIYLLGMATAVVVGTLLFQTVFVTAAATLAQALTTKAIDIVLARLLLLGSVVGARLGARFAQRAKPEYLRLALALLVLAVALRVAIGLSWRPAALFTVEVG